MNCEFAAAEKRVMLALASKKYTVLAWHDSRAFCCHWVSGALVRAYKLCVMQEDGAEFNAIRWH